MTGGRKARLMFYWFDTRDNIRYKPCMNIKKLTIQLVAFSLVLNGCSGQIPFLSTSTETPLPTSTEVPLPVATPLPMATATPLPAGRIQRGDQAFLAGDYDTALDAYSLAYDLTSDPEIRSSALVMIARIHFERGENLKALELFRQVQQEFQSPLPVSMAAVYLGDLLYGLGRFDESASAYEQYLTLRPGVLDDYYLEKLGDALTGAGRYEEAASAYQLAVERTAVTPPVWLLFKVATSQVELGRTDQAIETYQEILSVTGNDFDRAAAEFLIGQIYYNRGDFESAYGHFLTCVDNYPKASDSYFALVTLVNDNQTVDNLNRGIVDYYAGQYQASVDALSNYETETAAHDGTLHYYRALSYTYLKNYPMANKDWDSLIQGHPGDRFWNIAWDEKAYTQWYYQGNHVEAAQTLMDFVVTAPGDAQAPGYLYEAARIYERNGMLDEAAATWERLAVEYPSAEISYSGIYLSGITRYRQQNYQVALNTFQRSLVLATEPMETASAWLWIGKSNQALGDEAKARTAWQNALQADPGGYYSERARSLLLGTDLITSCPVMDLAVDLPSEHLAAKDWMRSTFDLGMDIDLDTLGPLSDDPRISRGQEFWRLGLYEEARGEYEAVRLDNELDPVNTFRLIQYFLDTGLYRSAIFASRQVLQLAGLDETATLNAPVYFNHVRYGAYYREIVLQAAADEEIDPLILFSLIRQESLYEGFIESSVGAKGLMQLMPETANQTVSHMGWPAVYVEKDIYRPLVNIKVGSHYLHQQSEGFNGDLFASLAAYNAGPGNAAAWLELSGTDPDLFLETIRFLETRQYLRSIVELDLLYRMFYCRSE
jgi:soluble lytic murein transglycosylase